MNKKALLISTPLVVVPTAIIITSAVLISKENEKTRIATERRKAELHASMGQYEKNNLDLTRMIDEHENETINIKTLRKSLKMSFDLYRGGSFDFTELNMNPVPVKDAKNVSYSEIINFIESAEVGDLTYLNDHFCNISFKKAFYTPMKLIPQITDLLEEWEANGPTIGEESWATKMKAAMITYGINQIWNTKERNWHTRRGTDLNDFNFYSENDKNENDISDLVSEENFKEYFRYEMKNGELKTFEELRNRINTALWDAHAIYAFLDSLKAPVVKFNLDDRFLLKFAEVDSKDIVIKHENNDGTGTSVNVNINNWDPVFGIKNSWYEYGVFNRNYYQKNVISPMFLIDDEKVKIVRGDEDEYDLYDNEVIANSVNYSMPLSYERIVNYKSDDSKFNHNNSKYSIKLNENRYFENKLHEQQTSKHGFIPMSDVDMYNETMTGDWYPHIRQEYATMWQYMTKYVQWGWKSTWPTPMQIDTAHKNGVEIYGTLFNDSPSSMILRLLADTEDGRYIWAENLIKIMNDTGVDGILWNAEIGGWERSGLTIASLKAWQRLTTYLDEALVKNNKKMIIYGNFNTELPRTPKEYIDVLKDGDDEYNYANDTSWWRGLTPSNGESQFYHYDENMRVIDKPLGYAHKNGINDLMLSFVDKDYINGVENNQYAGKYGVDISFAMNRNEFVKNNPEYNLIILGSDSAISGTNNGIKNYMQREMDFLTKENLASEYYADYMIFADGAGVVDPREKFEWEMSQYIARNNEQHATGQIIGTGGGYTAQNDTKFREINDYYGKGDWGQISQDPRTKSWAYSNYFQERSTIDDRDFYTAFNVGYGHKYVLNGENIYNDWQNIGFQDFYPSYRYLIDVYDKNNQLIDDSANNFTKRKINAFIDEVDDAYQGNDSLHYKGTLEKNESFINKLYVSNIAKNKEFSIFVKNDDDLQTTLQVWRNKQQDANEVLPTKTEIINGYKKLTFNVSASDVDKITSFGLKVRNISAGNKSVDLDKFRVGAISFNDPSKIIKSHDNVISNFYAETNNIDDVGINVKFEDQYFDENTRYVIYNSENKPVFISSRPEFHVQDGGNYTIKAFNPIGEALGSYQLHINRIKK